MGVRTPADLKTFLKTKYFLHITQEGLRLFRFHDIPNLISGLNGNLRYKLMPKARKSALRVRTRGDGQQPVVNGIHLTYFVGQDKRVVGGHHMHAPFFNGAAPLLRLPKR